MPGCSPVFVKLHSYFTPVISESFTFLFSNQDLVQASAVAMAFLSLPCKQGLKLLVRLGAMHDIVEVPISSYMML